MRTLSLSAARRWFCHSRSRARERGLRHDHAHHGPLDTADQRGAPMYMMVRALGRNWRASASATRTAVATKTRSRTADRTGPFATAFPVCRGGRRPVTINTDAIGREIIVDFFTDQ
jgi:hypothetical protein